MNKIIYFGENVRDFDIPVLNEREIRAAAGLLFVIMFISYLVAIIKGDLLLMKYALTIFLTDISIRVFINPKFSPLLIIGRIIVRNQKPEYVGAPQKKFAWSIGVILGAVTFTHIVVLNAYSPISGIICIICLVFLFFEAAFGICLGCKFYPIFYKEKAQYCPGEICDIRSRHDIQKISFLQMLTVLGFIVYVLITAYLFHDNFRKKPHDLFGKKIENKYFKG